MFQYFNDGRYGHADLWQLVAFGFSFSICYGTGVGLGRHEANVAPHDRESLKKAEYAFSVLYVSKNPEPLEDNR